MYKKSYNKKSKLADVSDDTTKTAKSEHELGTMGVSRSGRVRKKSSKLLGYESGAEELEKAKRKTDVSANASKSSPFKKNERQISISESIENEEYSNAADSDGDESNYPTAPGFEDSSVDTSGTDLDDDDLDDKMAIDDSLSSTHPDITHSRSSLATGVSTSQKSLYMIEKFAKKKKNGQGTKAGRKDKGKARFSAYMLWAREVRPDLMKQNPNIDFSHLSSKLSDLWATVPYTDKYMWKQKAKRMAMLAKNSDNREEAHQQRAQLQTNLKRKYMSKKTSASSGGKSIMVPQDSKKQPTMMEITSVNSSDSRIKAHDSPTSSKSVSTQPLDVAAHLKLLGESLSIIGQRLKEHEGQIAVSGSLSVLLDTLLCSMGPLMCLTQQIDEMNGCSRETLSSILDNIAYIMPGL